MCLGLSGSEGSTIEYVQLECDSSLVEELRGPLEPTSCCASA
jgi:hypothetical protein